MNLTEYFKNRLLKNLHEGKSNKIFISTDFSRENNPEEKFNIDPIDPLEAEKGEDDTVANLISRKKLMGHDYAAYMAAKAARIADAFNARHQRPARPSGLRRPARLDPGVESSSTPTEEEIQKTLRTRNLLDTVHHFSREHGIELNAEHIAGIDFSNPDISSHIAEITRRLM